MIKANVRAASIERLSDQWERHAYGRTLFWSGPARRFQEPARLDAM